MPNQVPPALLQTLCSLYPEAARARVFVNELGNVPPDFLEFSGPPKSMWFGLLDEIKKHVSFLHVLNQAKKDFPNLKWENVEDSLLSQEDPIGVVDLSDGEWKGATDNISFEKIIGSKSTLLPISFLEAGITSSRSVAKIIVPGMHVGSGFLVADNILLTNNHVLPDKKHAELAQAQFNFQLTIDGREEKSVTLQLDPDSLFETSIKDDWTAVRVEGDANADWGKLNFATETAKLDDNVNIIQHPGGQPKQVALHDNIVRFVSENRIQYLTDTMGGSSGSPVFNLQWEVVAIHHAGGHIPEPNTGGCRIFFRNEGIPIDIIRQTLVKKGLIQ
ncbi:serine protease [Gimesia maris]|uniref:trypsin-like serine peptidase n=1 Tax=Gimesia maris TaxID=122 RepID=UPI0030DCA7B4|tara:strand:- start:9947 stop:10942 length:996 start_codon:yes stop_codon:yes gene_type:complete